MRRPAAFGVVCGELAFLTAATAIDGAEDASTFATRLLWAAFVAVVLVGALVVIPALIRQWLVARGRRIAGTTLLVVGIAVLVAVDYVAFVVPAVWSETNHCLPPAGILDGRCELGPL